MPRNGSGTYSLPQPPFVAGTVISSAAVNSDFSDIATALTGSLPRDGQAGMLGQFKATDGSSLSPSLTFTNELTTGFHRPGAGIIGVSLAGVELGTFTTAGWNGSVVGGTISGTIISGQGTIPIGAVMDFAGATAPAGWLLCFGQAVSRTVYAAVFAITGTAFGTGDGSATFNLPDYRGRSGYGQDNMGGVTASRITAAVAGIDGTVLGISGGDQNAASHSHTGVTGNENQSHQHTTGSSLTVLSGSGSIVLTPAGTLVATSFEGATHNHNFVTATTFTGGSQNLPPAVIVAKIIYTGV